MAEKIRIGLILQGGSSWIGGAEYSRNLIKALYRLPASVQAEFELRLLADLRIEEALYADMPERFFRELHQELATPKAPMWLRAGRRLKPGFFQRWISLPSQARRLGIQFLFPFNRAPEDYGPVASAAWIPDFQHKFLPQYFSEEELAERDFHFANYARHAPCMVLSSEASARDFRQFYPDEAHKARVLPFCVAADPSWYAGDAEEVARKYELPKRYFIVCNQFWQHKNHRVVFEALGLLRERGIVPTIICTGKLGDHRRPEFAGEVLRMLDQHQIGGQVRMLGLIPRVDQVQLMRRALAVIQPSLFEGWSTVVEDCRALAKPVALSDLPVHREQNPPHAVYFDPHDARRLAEIMSEWWQQLPTGPDLEAEQHARQENGVNLEDIGMRLLSLARSVSKI